MSWLSDLGNTASDFFTGRWTGGGKTGGGVLGDIKADPWVLAAPAAAVAAPFVAPEIGALFGATEAAGLGGGGLGFGLGAGGEAAATGAATLDEIGLAGGSTLTGAVPDAATLSPEVYSTMASAAPGDVTAGAPSWLSSAGYTAPTNPASFAPTTPGGGFMDTLLNTSKWTLPGVAQAGGALAAGGGLLMNLLKGNAPPASENKLTNVAGASVQQFQQLTAEAQQLRGFLENGNLPPGAQAQINDLVNAQKARLVANAGKNGLSTDPTQNTALSQDLADADRKGLEMAYAAEQQLFQAGQQLLTSGLNELQLSGQLYTQLANMDRTDINSLTNAIAAFAASMSGGGKGMNISFGGPTSKAA